MTTTGAAIFERPANAVSVRMKTEPPCVEINPRFNETALAFQENLLLKE